MSTPQLLPCWSCRTAVLSSAGECPHCAAAIAPRALAPLPRRSEPLPVARWIRVEARSRGPRATMTQVVRRFDPSAPPCSVTMMSATVQSA